MYLLNETICVDLANISLTMILILLSLYRANNIQNILRLESLFNDYLTNLIFF